MKLLIQSAQVIHPASAQHTKTVDVLIDKGIIQQIAPSISDKDATLINGKGCILSPGFFDLNSNGCDPGLEHKETIDTVVSAAAAGGFTGIALHPNTQPTVHSKAEVEYIRNKAKGKLVEVHPIGAISLNREGKDLAELYDMQQSGAIAFSDSTQPVQDAGLLMRALLYAKGINALLMQTADDKSISGKGKVHESENSVMLGMKGIPSLAEEVMISRDLALAAHQGAAIHFNAVSCKKSVDIIRKAKKEGIRVTADVCAHHLALSEEVLEDFDSQYKVKPPLRGKEDLKALLAGLKDGSIDAIATQHTPHEIESKAVEFEIAAYGMIALETAFSISNTALKQDIILLVEALAIKPRQVLGLEVPAIEVGAIANLCLFNPTEKWIYSADQVRSKSKNSPFIGKELTGRVKAVIRHTQHQILAS